jgi:hypothetical protein
MPQIQNPIPFDIDPNALATNPVDSDRFVYTPWFVIYDPYLESNISHLPYYQLDRAALGLRLIKEESIKEKLLHRYEGLADHVKSIAAVRTQIEQRDTPTANRGAKGLTAIIETTKQLHQQVASAVRSGEVDANTGETLEHTVAAVTAATHGIAAPKPQPAILVQSTGGGRTSPGSSSSGGTMAGQTSVDALVASELGLLFLDRTRIRPLGFALGEHIQSFSLAPGEEVTLEMKTYSKKEESFEKSSEQEKTFDTELSSTLTTELNEGMTAENSRNTGDTSTMGVNVGGNIDGITFNVGPTSSSTLQNANRDSVTQSAKVAQSASAKVAARNRALHKTVFRVSSETRFETTAKRVFRNPNANTPIDLQFFKVLQRLQLSHERYGVRLCWSPVLADPGAALLARLEETRQAIYARASQAGAGPRPTQPMPPGAPPAAQPQVVSDGLVADKFDPVWGGQRYDYSITLLAPPGLQWDRQPVSAALTFTGNRPAGISITSAAPTPAGVLIVMHVGIEDNANPLKPQYWEPRGTATITVSAQFEAAISPIISVNDSYLNAMNAWRDAVATWEALDRQAKADAQAAADEEWASVLKKAIDGSNAMQEVIGGIMRSLPGASRNLREVDFLEDVFDWKNAGLRLYSGWWSGVELRDPSRPADSFVNASWARLYLPIKVGAEAQALRWIYDQVTTGQGSAATETLITTITSDLDTFRKTNFGSTDELELGTVTDGCPAITRPYMCLGRWEDFVPTDGTHLEVMQATSSAADDYSRGLLDDSAAVREQQIERGVRENALRQKAESDGLGQMSTQIDLNIGTEPPT